MDLSSLRHAMAEVERMESDSYQEVLSFNTLLKMAKAEKYSESELPSLLMIMLQKKFHAPIKVAGLAQSEPRVITWLRSHSTLLKNPWEIETPVRCSGFIYDRQLLINATLYVILHGSASYPATFLRSLSESWYEYNKESTG